MGHAPVQGDRSQTVYQDSRYHPHHGGESAEALSAKKIWLKCFLT